MILVSSELRHTLQSVRLERDKLKGELAVASSTVAKLSAETASLPVLLSRATKELGHITDSLSGGAAYPAVAESVIKFTGIIDALDGYEEVVCVDCTPRNVIILLFCDDGN